MKLHSILASALMVGFVFAEPADEERYTKAEELIESMGMKDQMASAFDAMLPVIEQMASAWNLNEDAKTELRAIYRSWFDDDLDHDGMQNQIVDMYAEAFTAEEMDAIIAFYKSDVGKKMLEKSPELTKKGAAMGLEEAQKKQAELMDRLQPFLKKHNLQ